MSGTADSIAEGARVIVFDPRLYVDDARTPLSVTMQPATVLRRYLKSWRRDISRGPVMGYDDVVDVRFDHDGRESRAHFTSYLKKLRRD